MTTNKPLMTCFSDMRQVVSQAVDAPAAAVFEFAKTRIDTSFRELLISDLFTEELRIVFLDLHQILYILNQGESIAVPPNFWTMFPLRVYFAAYRLCAIPTSSKHKPGDVGECIRLAGQVFINTVLVKNSPHLLMMRNLTSRLKRGLSALTLVELGERSPVILVWMLFVGAHGSRGQIERSWFVNLIARAALGLDWVVVKALLQRFLYLGYELDKPYELIWAEVKQVKLGDNQLAST